MGGGVELGGWGEIWTHNEFGRIRHAVGLYNLGEKKVALCIEGCGIRVSNLQIIDEDFS